MANHEGGIVPRKPPTVLEKYGPPKKDDRPSPSKRGYDKRHRRWREAVLGRDHKICQHCGLSGNEADHIVPLRRGGDWSLENGQTLCKRCHSRKTQRE